MFGDNFAKQIDNGSFFEQMDDLLHIPTVDIDDAVLTTNAAAFPPIWSSSAAAADDSVISGNTHDSGLSDPYEDIVQSEWLSNWADNSFPGAETLTIITSSLSPSNQFQTSSPVSVLKNISSFSGEKQTLPAAAANKRGRARRKRPSNSGELCPGPAAAKKAKKKNINKLWFRRDENGVRKCLHCEVTKTPQWRAGPLGPKTLCNACGVRYNSGRLFPEYRPAASPAFVPSLHSNSHKKVQEMRAKQRGTAAELIPNTKCGILFDR